MEVMHQEGKPRANYRAALCPCSQGSRRALVRNSAWSSGWASRVLRAADPALVVTQFSVGEGKGNPMSCLS